jgi:hypothetical protein
METSQKISQAILQSVVSKRVERMKQGLNPDKSLAGDPKHLAHYTTAQGLNGIVQHGNLWASGAYYLNDSSEMDYGCQLFTSLLAKLIAQEKLDPVPKSIFENAKKAFEPGGFMESVTSRTYVACFCEDENLLSQWRTYGQTGGYSIIFSRKALCDLTVNESYLVELQRVIYDNQLQSQLLELVLSDLLSTLLEENVKQLYKTADSQGKQLFVISFNTFLQTMAATEIVRFKHPAFEGEREWRLIVRPTSTNLNTQEIQHLQFRTARGMIVPYLEVHPKEGTLLPIEWVRYGPTLEKKRVQHSLDLLFKQKGYHQMTFKGSDIPVILP